jgi:hypothetical protein
MAKLRNVALWAVGATVVALFLWATGAVGPIYRWMVRYMQPEVWSALGTWFTAAVAAVTVLVAGRYAKQQVDEARRTREEQAQPNVVIYSELNPSVKQYIEIVVKNFGTTPAYNVKVTVAPPLKATPNLISRDKLFDVLIPEFRILAPGQEWRTGWDHSVSRKKYQDKMNRLIKTAESDLTDSDKLEREYWTTRRTDETTPEQRLQERFLPSRYKATVVYEDSHRKKYKTEAILDSDQYKGTTWVDLKSIHDLTKMLDKHLKEQINGLDAIHRRLAEFGTEHDGIWIYGSGDEDERDYRRRVAEAEEGQRREFEDKLFGRRKRPQPQDSNENHSEN